MALFGGENDELVVERLRYTVEGLRERLEEKDNLIDKLMTQIRSLQDALVAREAPEAYDELRRDRAEARITPEDRENMEKQKREFEIVDRYIRDTEAKVLNTPDDLKAAFLGTAFEATEPGPLHADDES